MKIVKPTPSCPEEEAYLAYIDEHRKNVYQAFVKFGKSICLCLSMVNGEYNTLKRYVSSHDSSKYSEDEFQGYRQWFYPKENENKNKDLFLKAWTHHYKTNRHHWEYWLENNEPKEMSPICIAEMLLDWIAMSIKFKNSPLAWYNENKDRIIIHKHTRQQVERILSSLSKYPVYPFLIHKRRHNKHNKK
jgi:hypothetical protein